MNLSQKILRSELMSSAQKVRLLAVLERLGQERLNELESVFNLEGKFEKEMLLDLESQMRISEASVRDHLETESN